MSAFSQSGEKWSAGGNSINANSFFGSLNDFPINFKIYNVQRMTLTSAGFLGLGTAAPSVMFECTGNGKINNFKVNAILTVGNKISVSKIFSPAGIIDFEGSNLKTTAGISGASLVISGNGTFGSITANSFQNPMFAGAGSGLILSDANGSFQKLDFDGNQSSYLRGDGTFGFLPSSDTWKYSNGNIYTVNNGFVGIGIDSPIEKLDVNGNANIRGYLYVQDGVIIGKRIDGQRVNSDTIDVKKLAIRYATTDSLTSLKLATEKMAVSRDINIGERAKIGTNIVIDGLTNNITTPGSITAGSITAGIMNVTNVVVDSSVVNSMRIVNNLKIGNNSMVIGNTGTSTDNNIYTDNENEPLLIQSSLFNNNTIINANNTGKVGIGTTTLNSGSILTTNGSIFAQGETNKWTNSHWNIAFKTPNSSVWRTDNTGQYLNRYLGFGMSDDGDVGGWYWLSTTGTNSTEDPLYHMKLEINNTTMLATLEIKGKIRSTEVIIEPQWWSDFVFNKDYKLLSLTELETFINTYHHLPGVPDAKEVSTDGVNVGDMNAILLKKIEELTLYVIELQKKNEQLEKDMNLLKK